MRELHYALLHVQLRGHGGLVLSWCAWCWLLTLVSVEYLVCKLDSSR